MKGRGGDADKQHHPGHDDRQAHHAAHAGITEPPGRAEDRAARHQWGEGGGGVKGRGGEADKQHHPGPSSVGGGWGWGGGTYGPKDD